jgi:uncharacterized cupin superfamily protein
MAPVRRVNLADPAFEDPSVRPDGFRARRFPTRRALGAERTGATLYELPPGQAVCPYHYEYGEEEWALVIEGTPSVRTPEGTELLAPLDLVFFPAGPAGAHQVRNDSGAPARVLMWSEVVFPTASAYPDSGKVGVWTGDEAEDLIVRREAAVDYFDGEA